jgi:hypothetical protein
MINKTGVKMKKFHQLKKNLKESENTEGGGFNAAYDGTTSRSAVSDFGIHRVEDNTQKNRLGMFLNAFASRDYLDPRSAIALLRAKLNLAGLDFDFNPGIPLVVNSEIRFPLTRFGGTFGYKIKDGVVDHKLTDPFERTDGISYANNGKGMDLIVYITNTGKNGLFRFNLKFEDAEDGSRTPSKL